MNSEESWTISNASVVTTTEIIPNATVVVRHGRIAAISTTNVSEPGSEALDAGGNLLLPGFIDLHIHGGRGFDVMDGTVEAIQGLSRHLAAHGVTGFLATTVTASQADTIAAAETVRQARKLPPTGSAILGMHLEGPYINGGRRGAQNPGCIRPPSIAEIDEVIAASGNCVRLVTIAPEVAGAHELAAHLRRRGIICSMGHTDATYEQALAGLDAGFTHATHIYNAMRSFQHRDPGIIGAVLTDQRAMVELIADGLHVHPAAARLLIQARGPQGVILISDAVRGAGLPFGCYRMSGGNIWTSERGARTADGHLAGSLLTLDVALRNVMQWTGLPLHVALAMASLNQARELGIDTRKGSIEVGKDADLVICTADLQPVTTMIAGRIVDSIDSLPPLPADLGGPDDDAIATGHPER
jgi:N-acetylglucosamine-6-phosphate deacetylase